ncbi:MAG: MFS transporter [Acidobacteriia bacterium]|nr:MFS transporter [Terriglobia bacterium]
MASAVETPFQTSGLVRLTRPQLYGTMAGLLLSVLLASLDQTIVGTAEPRIIANLSGFNRYPWVSTGYLLSSTIAVPIFAKLSDIYGRKWFFLLGAAMFVLTSALCGASGDLPLPFDGMNQLILFRSLQGVGGGMMMGLAFTIIGDIFSPVERGRYQGFFAATYGLSSIFGPTLGGWLTDSISWRSVFYVNLPVGIVAIAAILLYFPYWRPQDIHRRIDWAGVVSLIGCMVPLLLALTWTTDYGWGSARVESLLAMAAVMLAAFLYAEAKAIEPLIPLSLFRDPVVSVSSLAVFLLGMGMFTLIIYLPLFMQGVMGVSATKSGNLLTPMLMASVVGSITTGQLNLRMRTYKPQAVVGSILIAIGTILFARMDASVQYFDVVRNMVISGVGMGLLMPVYTVAVQNVAPRKYMGAATASTTFFRQIGSTLGVAIFGSILLTKYHQEFGKAVPAGLPADALQPFSNPLRLSQFQSQLEAAFAKIPGGAALLQSLYGNVRTALVHGLQVIFLISAVVMTAAVGLNLVLRNVPLRHHAADQPQPPAH